MATTQKGIYYNDDYTAAADVLEDERLMAESVDEAIGDSEASAEEQYVKKVAGKGLSTNDFTDQYKNQVDTNATNIQTNATNIAQNTQEINAIKSEQTTQNTNIQANADNITALAGRVTEAEGDISDIQEKQAEQNISIEALQEEVEDLTERVEDAENNEITNTPEIATSHYLQDSANSRVRKFIPIGRTTQESTSGRNHLPIIPSQSQTVNGVTLTSNGDGSFTLKGTPTAGGNIVFDVPNPSEPLNQTSYLHIRNNAVNTNSGVSLVFQNGATGSPQFSRLNRTYTNSSMDEYSITKIGAYFNVGEVINVTFTLSLELTDEVTDYEPYTGGEPAPNPNYPYAINNTGDNGSVNEKVSNSDGTQEQNISFPLAQGQKFYEGSHPDDDEKVHHKMGEVVFDGSDDESWNVSSGGTNGFVLIGQFDDIDINKNGYCNYFIYTRGIAWQGIGKCGVNQNKTFWCQMTSSMTLTEFKTWLSTHNLVVQYPLAEEITEDFTEEQKTAYPEWKKARTYKNVTHISSEDETPANVEITYVRDLETVINELSSAIVAQGGV